MVAVLLKTSDMADPLPSRSPLSSYRNGLAQTTSFNLAASLPNSMSLAESPSAMVSPKSPIAHASTKIRPLTRPRVIALERPSLATSIAFSISVGKPRARARLL